MKILNIFTLVLCIFSMSSCEILKDLLDDKGNDTRVVDEKPKVDYVCDPVSDETYDESFEIIKDKRSDFDRMKTVKRETPRMQCLTSSQIKRITELFGAAPDRWKYVEFAYQYCADPKKYYSTLKSLFNSEFDRNKLEELTRG